VSRYSAKEDFRVVQTFSCFSFVSRAQVPEIKLDCFSFVYFISAVCHQNAYKEL